MTICHLPNGPTAYFKLTSVELPKRIEVSRPCSHLLHPISSSFAFRSTAQGHARATEHFPELVLNGFVTRLGHTIGRLFQTLFPPMPEFQGRQVVTLHNQRDFLFFRRHRYAFRAPERVALQEIGPRFTLKLRWVKRGLPAVRSFGDPGRPLEFDRFEEGEKEGMDVDGGDGDADGDVDGAEDDAEDENGEEEAAGSTHQKVVPPTEDEYLWIWKVSLV